MSPGGYMNYSPRARRIARALDLTVGPPLGLLARGLAGNRSRGLSLRILLIRADHLGDLLMATPAVRALRRAWPEAHIEMLVSPGAAPALAGNADVDRAVLFDAPWYEPHSGREFEPRAVCAAAGGIYRGRFDVVVEMRGDPRMIALAALSGAPRRVGFARLGLQAALTDALPLDPSRSHLERNFDVLRPLDVAGPEGPEERRPSLPLDDPSRARAAEILRAAGLPGTTGYAVVAPATNRPGQTWGAGRFARVAAGLIEAGLHVVLTARASEAATTAAVAECIRAEGGAAAAGGAQPGGPPGFVDLTGLTDLPALGAVLEKARLLVANDGGTVHVAAAVGCPAIAVFGPTSPALSFPYEGLGGSRALAGKTACERPCFRSGCPDDHGYSALTPGEVLNACLAVLWERVRAAPRGRT